MVPLTEEPEARRSELGRKLGLHRKLALVLAAAEIVASDPDLYSPGCELMDAQPVAHILR